MEIKISFFCSVNWIISPSYQECYIQWNLRMRSHSEIMLIFRQGMFKNDLIGRLNFRNKDVIAKGNKVIAGSWYNKGNSHFHWQKLLALKTKFDIHQEYSFIWIFFYDKILLWILWRHLSILEYEGVGMKNKSTMAYYSYRWKSLMSPPECVNIMRNKI